MSRTLLAVLGMAAMAACSKGDARDTAAADSLNRDLQLAPVDTTRALNDQPAADTAARPAATTPSTATTAPRSHYAAAHDDTTPVDAVDRFERQHHAEHGRTVAGRRNVHPGHHQRADFLAHQQGR